jgi:pilus assembly protein CpaB
MSVRGVLLLALAVMLGGIAVFLARGWIEAQVPKTIVMTEPSAPAIALATVVVAKKDLFFGDRLNEGLLEEAQWPTERVPAGSFKSIDELLKQHRQVVRPIAKNEPVMASKLSGEGGRATLSAVVNDEMRAVTIRVDDVLGVAGYVLPGDRVDILLTRELAKGNPITNILLQNIKVLGIDQNSNQESDDPKVVRTITVEASPYQGQKLTLAAQVGSLSLALRNQLDVVPAPQRVVTLSDLGGGEINQSPNSAAVVGQNGGPATATVVDGKIVPAATSTADAKQDGEAPGEEPKAVVTTPLKNRDIFVTVLRGMQSTDTKVKSQR